MNWGMEDLAAAAGLLLAAALALTAVFRIVQSRRWRAILTVAVLVAVLAVWAQLAVGII
jgi:hypothetical protein